MSFDKDGFGDKSPAEVDMHFNKKIKSSFKFLSWHSNGNSFLASIVVGCLSWQFQQRYGTYNPLEGLNFKHKYVVTIG